MRHRATASSWTRAIALAELLLYSRLLLGDHLLLRIKELGPLLDGAATQEENEYNPHADDRAEAKQKRPRARVGPLRHHDKNHCDDDDPGNSAGFSSCNMA